MAKDLNFVIDGEKFSVNPEKLDRDKLYGWVDKQVTAENGELCKLFYVDDYSTVIPKGGIGQLIFDDSGKWVDKSQLVAKYKDGTLAQKRASSFDEDIELVERATNEEFLDYSITSVYALDGEGSSVLAEKLGEDLIYQFIFSYRADYGANTRFLLNSSGTACI